MNKNIRLIVIVFSIWALTAVAFGQANQWGPFDPGAARSTLSNVDPATGRAALELGTMAVATATDYVATSSLAARVDTINASFTGDIDVTGDVGAATINDITPGTMLGAATTDYVATDTFTDHTDATGASVHGLGTISTKADTDYVATSSLAARLDTINASFTGDIDVTGDVGAAKVSAAAYDTEDGDLLDMMAMINGFNPKRWGIRIEKANSNPDTRVTYLYDAVGMTPAAMNFASGTFNYGDWKPFCDAINRPVMLDAAGTVVEVLDPNDQTKTIDGIDSSISSASSGLNAMAEFKRLWLKQYEDASYEYIIFSNVQYDPDYRADAFTNANGTIRDRMYYAMFEGSYVAPRLRSIAAGSVMSSQTGQTEIERAEANGAGWHINYKSQRDLITYLLWLISKSTYDMQKFGNGNSGGASYLAPGTLKSAGQFMGYNTTTQAVKTFFIENYWGNYWKRMSGLLLATNGEIRTKLTPPYTQPPLPDENFMPAGYATTGITPSGTSGAHLKNAVVSPTSGFLPAINGGAENTYYTCGMWYAAGTTIKWARVGGNRSNAGLCGAGTVTLDNPLSHASSRIGAALSFLKP